MTADDDAFIRTIVDSPGNDVPRLVYVDFLDDRDDPRGPFLRAEVEWAQPWKEGQRPGDATELRAMAAGLDPLWVARVARPPLGVCADHVRLTKSGPPLDSAELGHVEERLGVKLPCAFRGFLLNYNGGTPTPNCLPYPPSFGWDDMDMALISFFTASRRKKRKPKNAPPHWEFELEETLDHLNSLYRIGGDKTPIRSSPPCFPSQRRSTTSVTFSLASPPRTSDGFSASAITVTTTTIRDTCPNTASPFHTCCR